MSKVEKKPIERKRPISELDIKFEKIIQFSGWIFLLALGGFIGGWAILDEMLDLITLDLDAMTFSFIIFTGTNSAISFGLATKIKNNQDNKRSLFFDWLLGEFLFCMIAIFAVAAYQW
ncbi:hypothetical protein LCGC14_0625520 [marine sediment metagenome]|uniref:Uncharacterized protein n=1 Tax=marine sediment metagenome TaxID=412755 RepID=A0A0F9RMY9_9ZZZZ|nr:MAG: hypothetical protein Lokiarch_04100 [Candidatus Lokiarchaeum sp. GC14_75]